MRKACGLPCVFNMNMNMNMNYEFNLPEGMK